MADDYELFKQKAYRKTGIDLSSYKEKQMKRRIFSLANRNGYNDFLSYFELIDKDDDKLEEFINFLTINVSEFYRNPEQWKVVENSLFPALLKNTSTLKIWSAACSTGEEPYTMVMILSGFMDISRITIEATDIDDGAMEKAKRGLYSLNSLKNVPPSYKEKYFTKVGANSYQIIDKIKSRVNFRKHNLLKDPFISNCDLIVCRNVMIYFTDEAKDIIYQKFSDSLKPEGVLFVGATEQIIAPANYGLKSLRTFFYGKEDNELVL